MRGRAQSAAHRINERNKSPKDITSVTSESMESKTNKLHFFVLGRRVRVVRELEIEKQYEPW